MERLTVIGEFCQYLGSDCGFSPHTPRCYGADLDQFADFLFKGLREKEPDTVRTSTTEDLSRIVCEAGADNIKSFIDELTRSGYSSATIARKIASLRTFYEWALESRRCASNPMKKIPTYRVTRQLPPTLSTDEVLKLLESPSDTTTQGLRDRAMLEVLYSAALNVDEVTKLQIGDITFTESGAKLTIKKREKSKKDREVLVDPHTAEAIKDFIASVLNNSKYAGVWAEQKPTKPLLFNKFGNAVSPRCVRRTVEKYARAAQLRDNISPKTLRHSRGVHLTIVGWAPSEIMEFFGHRSRTGTTTYRKIIDANETNAHVAVLSPQGA